RRPYSSVASIRRVAPWDAGARCHQWQGAPPSWPVTDAEPVNTMCVTGLLLASRPKGAVAPATRARYRVLTFLWWLFFLLYIDRVCIGKAAPHIKAELGLTDTEMGMVFGAFTLAYGLFEVPTGRWGDRYGSRGVLTRIVLWWSAF